MDYTVKPFSNLDSRSLERLAYLHQSVMHLLLNDLGFPMVLRYYQIAREDPAVIGFYAVSSTEEILGWVIGSPNPYALNTRMRTPLSWFLGQMIRLAATRPLVFLQVLFSVFSPSGRKLPPCAIELTYMGVAPEAQGRGVGRELVEVFAGASRSAGYCSVELTTETSNLQALALYEKSGFIVKRAFREGRFKRYRMERKLSS